MLYRAKLLVSVTNDGFVSLTKNFIASLARVGLPPQLILILCTDTPSYEKLLKLNLDLNLLRINRDEVWSELHWNPLPDKAMRLSAWGQPLYFPVVQVKVVVVSYLLKLNLCVFMQDTDIVHVRKVPSHGIDAAIDAFNNQPESICLMCQLDWGWTNGHSFFERNTGFYIARPLDLCRKILDDTLNIIRERHSIDDQSALNLAISRNDALWATPTFDEDMFVTGRKTFKPLETKWITFWDFGIREHWKDDNNRRYPFVIHANVVENQLKEKELKRWHLWFVEDLADLMAPYSDFWYEIPKRTQRRLEVD